MQRLNEANTNSSPVKRVQRNSLAVFWVALCRKCSCHSVWWAISDWRCCRSPVSWLRRRQWVPINKLKIFPNTVQCSTLVWALLLPSVGTSLYFYSAATANQSNASRNGESKQSISTVESTKKQLDEAKKSKVGINGGKSIPKFSAAAAFAQLSNQFKTSYSNPVVIKWSIWWAIAMCGYLQVNILSIVDPSWGRARTEIVIESGLLN